MRPLAFFESIIILSKLSSSFVFQSFVRPQRIAGFRRYVTIYAPDGTVFDDEDDGGLLSPPFHSSGNEETASLMSMISKEASAELARLAVAFCPPDLSLDLGAQRD